MTHFDGLAALLCLLEIGTVELTRVPAAGRRARTRIQVTPWSEPLEAMSFEAEPAAPPGTGDAEVHALAAALLALADAYHVEHLEVPPPDAGAVVGVVEPMWQLLGLVEAGRVILTRTPVHTPSGHAAGQRFVVVTEDGAGRHRVTAFAVGERDAADVAVMHGRMARALAGLVPG